MEYEVRRLGPGDEQLALQVVCDLMPEDERDGRESDVEDIWVGTEEESL
jgi:hypothetical protein